MFEKSKAFKSENHSLFVGEKPVKIQKIYRVFIGAYDNQKPDFHDILNELYNASENSELELRIMSPGGLVVECQQIVNLMQNKFKDKSIAYIESHASSAGAITFVHAKKRVIYWNSRIMFHNYSGGYIGDYHKMKTRIDFDSKHTIGFLEPVKQFLTKKEWKKMINGKEYWFGAEEMLERGIATHLILNGKEYEGKKALKKLKKFLKKKENNYIHENKKGDQSGVNR